MDEKRGVRGFLRVQGFSLSREGIMNTLLN